MGSKALRVPASERAQNGGIAVPAPIILSITVSDDDIGRCVCNMLDATASWEPAARPCRTARSSYPGRGRPRFGRRRRSLVPPSTWQACACKCSLAPGRAHFELAWTRGEYPSLLAVECKSPTAGGSYGATQ
jgi:hypothetical protein